MGCAYTGSGGGPMRTEMPTETCPNDTAENDNRRMLNNTQRTMDRFIRWTFLDFVPRPNTGFACDASLCRKTPETPWLRSSCYNPGLPRMLRSKNTENEEVSSLDWRDAGASVLNQTCNVRGGAPDLAEVARPRNGKSRSNSLF